jgi:hypothetical protein
MIPRMASDSVTCSAALISAQLSGVAGGSGGTMEILGARRGIDPSDGFTPLADKCKKRGFIDIDDTIPFCNKTIFVGCLMASDSRLL